MCLQYKKKESAILLIRILINSSLCGIVTILCDDNFGSMLYIWLVIIRVPKIRNYSSCFL